MSYDPANPNKVAHAARHQERNRCLKAVDDEPELPGAMPDEMWEAIRHDRDATENALRLVVQQTKSAIRERILG